MESKPLLLVVSPDDFREVSQDVVLKVPVEPVQSDDIEAEKTEETILEENQQPINDNQQITNELLLKQLQFLCKPFQQKVYQPLQIIMQDDTRITVEILQINGAVVCVFDGKGEQWINGNLIREIHWQNKPFPKI